MPAKSKNRPGKSCIINHIRSSPLPQSRTKKAQGLLGNMPSVRCIAGKTKRVVVFIVFDAAIALLGDAVHQFGQNFKVVHSSVYWDHVHSVPLKISISLVLGDRKIVAFNRAIRVPTAWLTYHLIVIN
jgi:hypothetical protein